MFRLGVIYCIAYDQIWYDSLKPANQQSSGTILTKKKKEKKKKCAAPTGNRTQSDRDEPDRRPLFTENFQNQKETYDTSKESSDILLFDKTKTRGLDVFHKHVWNRINPICFTYYQKASSNWKAL